MSDINNNYRLEYLFNIEDFKIEILNKSVPFHAELYKFFIKPVLQVIRDYGIKNVYWWYEPYIEITWQGNEKDQKQLFKLIEEKIKSFSTKIGDYKFYTPEDRKVGEWFANSEQESRFGERRYARATEMAEEFLNDYHTVYSGDWLYKDTGKGIEKQVERTIHAICNPLGIGYWEEAKLCFSRGLVCFLFCCFKFSTAVWIYRNVFRQKY